MYILGIYYGHNATAALLKDGKIIGCISEERFNGIKNFLGLPKKSISYLLAKENITTKDIDRITISHSYAVPMHYSKVGGKEKNSIISLFLLLNIPLSLVRNLWGYFTMKIPTLIPIGALFYNLGVNTIGKLSNEKELSFLANYLNIDRKKIFTYDHHLSHAAAAYYSSKFNSEKSLVFTADGEGDLLSASISIFNNKNYKVISKTRREQSLGYLYAYLTEFLGMKANEHEYKVMGLAAYAKKEDIEKVYKKIENLVIVDKTNLTFKSKVNLTDAKRYLKENMQEIRFDILAGAFQMLLEKRICEWIEATIKKTNISTVVLSGGVFMNVKVNQRVSELSNVKKIFIMPSCGDESSILGSSYLSFIESNYEKQKFVAIPPIEDLYWGPSFSNEEVKKILTKKNAFKKYKIQKIEDIEKETAILLSKGAIVARLRGKMEFGARALGNRSIIADPRNLSVIRVINEQIKNRDFWMPFAVSMLEESSNQYIINPKKIDGYYMMITFNCTDKGKKELIAGTHQYDFTTRPQIVKQGHNPLYYKLIKNFERITGIGAVLNTSFNLHGLPIVLGPEEALYAFEKSELQYLTLEDYLISKK